MEFPLRSRRRPYGPILRLLNLLLVGPLLFFAPALAQAKPQQLVLALGDSLTAGYQLKPGESFPAQLQTALQAQGLSVKVHNAGVSGDTMAQGKARLPWVLGSLKQTPDLAIVALGANDMLRGQPPAQARANLDAILAEFDKRGIPVIVAGMLAAPNLGPAYAKEFNALYPQMAKKHGATLHPFFTQGVTANPKLLLTDGMHPNRQGVALMVKNILPVVKRELARK